VAEHRTRLRLLVASPGDTEVERETVDQVVAELNRGIADERGLVLDVVKWETYARPGVGQDAQDVINRQLPSPDLVVGVFWKRLGTPTPRAPSGTAEELESALRRWEASETHEILVYFNKAEYTPTADDLPQLSALLGFRDSLERLGVLVWDYNGPGEFETLLRQHLTGAIRDWSPQGSGSTDSPSTQTPSPEILAEEWYKTLSSAGYLETDFDARQTADIHSFMAVLTTVMRERGFHEITAARTTAALTELLINVARHTPEGITRTSLQLHQRFVPRVAFAVRDQGGELDLHAKLVEHLYEVTRGRREHGLLHVSRLVTHLYAARGEDPWTNVISGDIYDVSPRQSALKEFPFVAAVGITYQDPEVYWLGDEPYSGDYFMWVVRAGVEWKSRELLDLFFRPLAARSPTYLACEIEGPSGAQRLPDTADLFLDNEPKPDVFLNALEAYFGELFAAKRVAVLLSGETARLPLTGWKESGVRVFTDERACRLFLQEASSHPTLDPADGRGSKRA
jgi:anti-sigma regulatory factor (Ser/Thr protein kinase)